MDEKTGTLVFEPHLGNPIVEIMLCVLNESFWGVLIFSYWGFRSPFDVWNESHEFLK